MPESASINVNFSAPPQIRSASNLAQLRHILSNTVVHGDNVVVDGAVRIGDGGGGAFVFDSTSTDADDNALTITPDDVGIHPGRWKIVEKPGGGDAGAILYGGQYLTVRDALDALLYVAPVVSGFTATPSLVETGTNVTTVALSWNLNKNVNSQAIANLTAIAPTDRTISAIGPFTADKSWTLAVNDGKNTVSATTSLRFQQRRYWGVSPSTTLTNAQILGLSSEFATTKSKAIAYNCSGGNYPYYAYPASWGDPAGVIVAGLGFTDLVVTTQDFTNSSGYTSPYKVVRSGYIQTGPAIPFQWN